jgi:hypothetical protein
VSDEDLFLPRVVYANRKEAGEFFSSPGRKA